MRRRLAQLAVGLITVAATMSLATAASADNAGPCNDAGGPGNSDYAMHRIVALAYDGALGDGGHKPGSHQGFSLCLGVHTP